MQNTEPESLELAAQAAFEGFEDLINDEALANRHRPTRLRDVVGQQDVVRVLMAQNRSGQGHPVKLFSGPSGCGKTTIARALAAFELCENPDLEAGDNCGVCATCRSVVDGRGQHPDVHEHDASSNTSRKEDIESLVRRFDVVPMMGKVQVFILDEAQGLSRAANNALLTHIERLAPHNRLYLLTTEPESVLPTIRSRAEHHRLELPAQGAISEFLLKIAGRYNWPLTPEIAQLIVELTPDSEGVRQAVTNLSKLSALFEGSAEVSPQAVMSLLGGIDHGPLEEIVDAVASGDAASALKLTSSLRERVAARELYRGLARVLRRRWREAVLTADPLMRVYTQLSDEILEALGSQDYVDYLVELALVSAAAKVAPAPAVVGAPVAATPVEASPAPEAEPLFEPEPEVPAEPVVELSAPEEAPMEPSSAETSSELRDRLVAELEAQSPRPSIALALVGQHAVVSTKNGGLLVAMPSQPLADRLSDPRHLNALKRAATNLGFSEVDVVA